MGKVGSPIGPKLIRNIILISTFFSIFATGIQLYSDYKGETYLMNIRLDQIKSSSLDSLTLNLWQNNDKLINIQLKSLLSFPDITYASILEDEEVSYSFGEDLKDDSIEKSYPLVYLYNDKEYKLGTLKLQAGLGQIRDRLKDKFYLIAITQSIKTFIVAFIILYIFSQMVSRHLYKVAYFAREMSEDEKLGPLKLERPSMDDELSLLVQALNTLQNSVRTKLTQSEESNANLDHINTILKKRIELQETDSSLSTKKEHIDEMRNMLEMIGRGSPEEIQNDIESLKILFKRAFKTGEMQ